MNPFFSAFVDELNKLAEEDKGETAFERAVHHPVTQALGYGALAGEGAHLLAEHGRNKMLSNAAKTKTGRGIGKASLIGGTAFLGAEGAAALIKALRGKQKDSIEKKGEKDTKKVKPEELSVQQLMTVVQQMADAKLREASSHKGMRDAFIRRMAWGG